MVLIPGWANWTLTAALALALGAPLLLLSACGDDVSFSESNTSASSGANSGSGSGAGVGGGDAAGGQGAGGEGAGTGGAGGAGVSNNGFPNHWIDGTDCGNDPSIQQWAYAEDTYILRQSLCTNFEGPFVYLLLGDEAAFVQDTGTGNVDLYTPIAQLVADWSSQRGLGDLPIYVTHTHSHGDHVGGDSQFAGKPNVTLVGTSTNAVQNFFGFNNWPDDQVTLDLGDRVLDVLAIPGHQGAHVAVYDRRHRLLLTGDTLYPGRLYINNWQQYRTSIPRMVDFAMAGNPIDWVLGTHIEMKASGGDFNFGATQHPDEHQLQLSFAVLQELNDAVAAMGNSPSQEEHADFIIYP